MFHIPPDVLKFLVGQILFNAMVQALEPPTERDGRRYRYVYRVSHLLAFNFQYAFRAQFPQYVPPSEPEKEPVSK